MSIFESFGNYNFRTTEVGHAEPILAEVSHGGGRVVRVTRGDAGAGYNPLSLFKVPPVSGAGELHVNVHEMMDMFKAFFLALAEANDPDTCAYASQAIEASICRAAKDVAGSPEPTLTINRVISCLKAQDPKWVREPARSLLVAKLERFSGNGLYAQSFNDGLAFPVNSSSEDVVVLSGLDADPVLAQAALLGTLVWWIQECYFSDRYQQKVLFIEDFDSFGPWSKAGKHALELSLRRVRLLRGAIGLSIKADTPEYPGLKTVLDNTNWNLDTGIGVNGETL